MRETYSSRFSVLETKVSLGVGCSSRYSRDSLILAFMSGPLRVFRYQAELIEHRGYGMQIMCLDEKML